MNIYRTPKQENTAYTACFAWILVINALLAGMCMGVGEWWLAVACCVPLAIGAFGLYFCIDELSAPKESDRAMKAEEN